MDLLTKAVQDVKWWIPYEILRMAYTQDRVSHYVKRSSSLEELIREKTIIPRVVVDTNIAGGPTIVIPLDGLSPITMDDQNYIFEIPPDRTENRTIMSVLAVLYYRSELSAGYQHAATPSISPMQGTDLSTSAHRAMDSRGSIPIVSTHEASVVGHNVIMVRNHLRTASMTGIRCRVEHDENLANLPIQVAPTFSKLCLEAVKAFIHTELRIKLDRGLIDRGHDIGSIKSIIDEYADANQNYVTIRDEEWNKVQFMADRPAYEDVLKLMHDPGI